MRIGFGYDVHPYEKGRPFVLGGIDFGYGMGLGGHSDADCLAHAIIDALLGAAALGDIGTLFPSADPQYEGASSLALLEAAARRLAQEGWKLSNCDATVACEAPLILPRAAEMRAALASALGCKASQVSIKATTEEKMGFTGRMEGVKCYAVCLVESAKGSE
jgi:2-C-methyl-D-erythritol 4-phosphate cytidylyltransferase/2-C-methyl-D-erythritol 2,4-cyclodiphosphate synthase